jgi:O-antigen/teichoic acid export membrane protein
LYARKRYADLHALISGFALISFLTVVPLAMITAAFPEIIIRVLFGESFLPAALALRIIAYGSLLYSTFIIFQTALLGIGKPAVNAKLIIIVSFLNLVLNILLVPYMGIVGSALALVAAYFVGWVLAYEHFKKFVKITIPLDKSLKIIVSAVVTTGFIELLKSLTHPSAYIEAVLILIPAALLYAALIIYTKAITRNDAERLSQMGVPIPRKLITLLK